MLQRSVTLIRKLLWTRPKESMSRSSVSVIAGRRLFRGKDMSRSEGRRSRCIRTLYQVEDQRDTSAWLAAARSGVGWGQSRMHPLLGAVGPDLFLPDGDDLF